MEIVEISQLKLDKRKQIVIFYNPNGWATEFFEPNDKKYKKFVDEELKDSKAKDQIQKIIYYQEK